MVEVSGIGALTAFVAGIISFLSPCVLPLVPGYLSYVAGHSVVPGSAEATGRSRTFVVGLSLCFVLGFSAVFVKLADVYGRRLKANLKEKPAPPKKKAAPHPLLPIITLLMVGLHLFYVKYHKLSPLPESPEKSESVPFTRHMAYLQRAGAGVFLLICLLALTIAPPLGEEPVLGMEVTKPPWQFVWVYALENLWVPLLIVAPALTVLFLVSIPFFPKMAKLLKSGNREIKGLLSLWNRNLALVFVPVFALFFIFADPVITLLYGLRYAESVPVFKLLLLALPFKFLSHPPGYSLSALNLHRKRVAIQGGTALFNIAANYVLIPIYGIVAACVTTLLSCFLLYVLYQFNFSRFLATRARP